MRADVLVDDEHLLHDLPGICPSEVKQVEVTCHLMHADFFRLSFYTFA
jgi:hypothetical protein